MSANGSGGRRGRRRRRVDGAVDLECPAVLLVGSGGTYGGMRPISVGTRNPPSPATTVATTTASTVESTRSTVAGPTGSAAPFGESRLARGAHRVHRYVEAAGHRPHLVDGLPQQQVEAADDVAAVRPAAAASGVGQGS